jgi:hypothetical protein
MKAEYPLGRQPRLQDVSTIFAQWRSTRKPRSRIPEHLWQAAVDLAPFYSIHQIARALRLNYTELKHRISWKIRRGATGRSRQFANVITKRCPGAGAYWGNSPATHGSISTCYACLLMRKDLQIPKCYLGVFGR